MEDVSSIRAIGPTQVEQVVVQAGRPGQNMTQGRHGQYMTQGRPGQNMTQGRTGQNMTQGRTGQSITQGRTGQNMIQGRTGQEKTRTNLRMESSNHRRNTTSAISSPDNQTVKRRCSRAVVKCSKFTGLVFLSLYFIIVPCVMLYFGASSLHCEDLFPIWLIVGGVLCYVTLIVFVIYMCMAMRRAACTGIPFYVFGGFSFLLCCWWVFGFARLAGSARYAAVEKKGRSMGIFDEPWVSDPFCKQYLLDFPFWLTLSPLILLGLLGILGTIICCFK